MSLLVPSAHWEDISIYFALGLPQTKKGVIVFPSWTDFPRWQVLYLVTRVMMLHMLLIYSFCEIVRLRGMSTTYVSYRGTEFLNHF